MRGGNVGVIVKLTDASVASYRGGVNNMKATNPAARGAKTLDLKSKDLTTYRNYLKGKQDAFSARLAGVKGAKVTGNFDLVLNAVSAVVPSSELATIANMPGVATIYPDSLLKLETDVSPQFIGAPTVWSSLGGQQSAGEGVIVGVLDTGIWPEHASYSDPDPSGKPYAAPPAAPDGSRACEFTGGANPGPAFTCNNKLIGADRRFMATYDAVIGLLPGEFTTARDDNGHGTHTSSTAAGNGGVAATIFGSRPRHHLGHRAARPRRDVQGLRRSRAASAPTRSAAVQAAIGDGVNVINFSISGGANPYSDAVELAFLDAYNAGVFVAASAGNSGPGAETTDHRGPWVTTVAPARRTRAFVNSVNVTGRRRRDAVASRRLADRGRRPGSHRRRNWRRPLLDAGRGQARSPDKIVVCKRGNPAGRAEKGFNVLQGGAVGMVLYNSTAGQTDQETDNHWLPASHIQFSAGHGPAGASSPATPASMATHDGGRQGRRAGRRHGVVQLARWPAADRSASASLTSPRRAFRSSPAHSPAARRTAAAWRAHRASSSRRSPAPPCRARTSPARQP